MKRVAKPNMSRHVNFAPKEMLKLVRKVLEQSAELQRMMTSEPAGGMKTKHLEDEQLVTATLESLQLFSGVTTVASSPRLEGSSMVCRVPSSRFVEACALGASPVL